MKEISVVHDPPPVYPLLKNKFNVDWDKDLIIAYNKKIYCKGSIAPQKIIHENVHLEEQEKVGNDAWWKMYLENDVFRFEQELLAYKAEVKFIKKYIKNREERFFLIRAIAENFSSGMYGNLITRSEAMRLLL